MTYDSTVFSSLLYGVHSRCTYLNVTSVSKRLVRTSWRYSPSKWPDKTDMAVLESLRQISSPLPETSTQCPQGTFTLSHAL